jgi:hypothetical protein
LLFVSNDPVVVVVVVVVVEVVAAGEVALVEAVDDVDD